MIHFAETRRYSLAYELHALSGRSGLGPYRSRRGRAPIDVVDAVNQPCTRESVMKKFLLASTAAVLMSASFANAAMLIYSDENDNKVVINSWADKSHGAGIVTSTTDIRQFGATAPALSARPASRGFLLHSDGNDHKLIENQFAQ